MVNSEICNLLLTYNLNAALLFKKIVHTGKTSFYHSSPKRKTKKEKKYFLHFFAQKQLNKRTFAHKKQRHYNPNMASLQKVTQ